MNSEGLSGDADGTEAGMVLRNIMLLIIAPWGVPLFFILWQPQHVQLFPDVIPLSGWLVLSAGTTYWCYRIARRYQLVGPNNLDEEEMVPVEDVRAIKTKLAICFVVLVLPALALGVLGPVLWS